MNDRPARVKMGPFSWKTSSPSSLINYILDWLARAICIAGDPAANFDDPESDQHASFQSDMSQSDTNKSTTNSAISLSSDLSTNGSCPSSAQAMQSRATPVEEQVDEASNENVATTPQTSRRQSIQTDSEDDEEGEEEEEEDGQSEADTRALLEKKNGVLQRIAQEYSRMVVLMHEELVSPHAFIEPQLRSLHDSCLYICQCNVASMARIAEATGLSLQLISPYTQMGHSFRQSYHSKAGLFLAKAFDLRNVHYLGRAFAIATTVHLY